MNNDDTLFKFDAPKTIVNLYEIANSNYEIADKIVGSKVFKSKCLFPDAFGPSIRVPYKFQNKKVLNSQGETQVVEKQLNTIPKPFSFESRKLCSTKHQCVMGTEQQWSFKARPATVLKKKPFVPKHEKKYTKPRNVCLNTERRAQEWMVFELEVKEKFLLHEKNRRMKEEEMKKKELDLIKKLRQGTVHKPGSIKKYKPVLIKKSRRPVTVPQSPKFSIRLNRNCLC